MPAGSQKAKLLAMQQQRNYTLQSAAGQKMFLHLPREKSVVFGMKSKYLLQGKKK